MQCNALEVSSRGFAPLRLQAIPRDEAVGRHLLQKALKLLDRPLWVHRGTPKREPGNCHLLKVLR